MLWSRVYGFQLRVCSSIIVVYITKCPGERPQTAEVEGGKQKAFFDNSEIKPAMVRGFANGLSYVGCVSVAMDIIRGQTGVPRRRLSSTKRDGKRQKMYFARPACCAFAAFQRDMGTTLPRRATWGNLALLCEIASFHQVA